MSEDKGDIERAREVWEPVTDPLMVGWTQQRNKGGVPIWFRSPAGEQMSARQYGAHRKQVRGEQPTGSAKSKPAQVIGVPDLPVPDLDKPDAATKKAGLATPEELAEGAYVGLMLLTGLSAFFLSIPELGMTREEAWAFAVPIGNITERSVINRRYGKYLKEGSDYLYLGYALWAYGSRMGQDIQARRMQEGQIQQSGGGRSLNVRPASSESASPSSVTPLPSVASAVVSSNGNVPQRPANDNRTAPARAMPFTPKVG